MKKRYIVSLTEQERAELTAIVSLGRESASKRRRAQVLLLVDQGEHGPALTDIVAAEQSLFSRRTVELIRERFSLEGLQSSLSRKPQSRTKTTALDGEGEAKLIALACSDTPEGRARWTIRLLKDKLIELEVVESISRETVRRVLKKHHQTLAKADVVYSS